MLSNSVQATYDTMSTMNYEPSAPAEVDNSKLMSLLAEYLPIIAGGMNVDVTVKQSDTGTFEAVRRANNKLVTATGYHALA